jgi:hypothetical protein
MRTPAQTGGVAVSSPARVPSVRQSRVAVEVAVAVAVEVAVEVAVAVAVGWRFSRD